MNNRLLFLDTETGGIDPRKHSLLSIGIVIWDSAEGIIYSDEYYVRSESYVVTAEAARINHFDKAEQERKAIRPEQIVEQFLQIKKLYFSDYTAIPLAGHNISFDVQFLKQMFLSCNRSYDKLFHHRSVDTYTIIKFLSDCQLIPSSVNSSASAFSHFKISVTGRHTALGDALATMQLYTKLIELVQNNIHRSADQFVQNTLS